MNKYPQCHPPSAGASPPSLQAALGSEKCSLGISLEEQPLGSAPLQLITSTLCSQELLLSNDLLRFMDSLANYFTSLNGTTSLFSHFHGELPAPSVARMKRGCD